MKYLFTILATIFAISASAQNIQPQEQEVASPKKIKERLALPAQRDSLTVVSETVQIVEHGDAATIVEQHIDATSKAVNGYRIVIFMSNAQTARRDAVLAQENFAQLFPQERSYLSYENPYFKVAVGNCTTQEEAMILLGRLRGTFPKAFIMRESIAIGEFTR
ncbi:MAG: hypothetical protein J6J57_01690 [Alistipes sp.]|nr:hypothetical protein [Alistipes sp.]